MKKYFNLASERTRLGMNQTQLAERLGCSKNSIVKWEKDISTMPTSILLDAASIFGCSADYLLNRTSDRITQPSERQ